MIDFGTYEVICEVEMTLRHSFQEGLHFWGDFGLVLLTDFTSLPVQKLLKTREMVSIGLGGVVETKFELQNNISVSL